MKTKSFLIIGLGRFGKHLAHRLIDMRHDVMIVDKDPAIVDTLIDICPDASIGDCTNESVLKSLDVGAFDVCFVTIGEDFESSLIITTYLKKYGAKCVVAKANQTIQADLLKRIGADEILFPEREMADKIAVRYDSGNIFDYIPLTGEYSIYELAILKDWIGKTIIEVNVRKNYQLNIIAIKTGTSLDPVPGADYVFTKDDHIVVIGKLADVAKITSKQ